MDILYELKNTKLYSNTAVQVSSMNARLQDLSVCCFNDLATASLFQTMQKKLGACYPPPESDEYLFPSSDSCWERVRSWGAVLDAWLVRGIRDANWCWPSAGTSRGMHHRN